MPAKRKPKMQIRPDAFRARREEETTAKRHVCSHLLFWKYCGRKQCLRARACVGDTDDCFLRLWPVVPEQVKIGIRAAAKARQARLSKPEIVAEIKRELARWRETMARQTAPQATPRSMAEPAPQLPPIMRAAPRAPGPRLRVL
jgi:hypothetical protein